MTDPGESPLVRVTLSDPMNGWLTLGVRTPDAEVAACVSYVPNDFVRELVTALALAAKGGEGTAVANTEPDRFEFGFVPDSGRNRVRLSVIRHVRRKPGRGTVVLSVEATPEAVLLPFVEALGSLGRRVGAEQYRDAMRREFPAGALDALRVLLRDG